MNTFKSIYYFTLSTRVANYEVDQQPSLQAVVMKAGLCSLFGILNFAERAHLAASNSGGTGALTSGGVASEVIPSTAYLRPAMIFRLLLQKKFGKKKFGTIRRTSIITILVIAMALTNAGMVVHRMQLLMSSVLLIVILLATIIIVSTSTAGNLASIAYSKLDSRRHD